MPTAAIKKRKKKGNKGGRPTVITPEAIRQLESAFLIGCTDLEACLVADISKTAFYAYQAENPEFADRKEVLKSNTVMLARGVILDALQKKDLATAHKVLDRKEGSKVALDLTLTKPIVNLVLNGGD